MNPLVSTSAVQCCQNDIFFAEINIALMFPIAFDSGTKYRLVSRESQVLLAVKRGYKSMYSVYCCILLSMSVW